MIPDLYVLAVALSTQVMIGWVQAMWLHGCTGHHAASTNIGRGKRSQPAHGHLNSLPIHVESAA